MSTPAIEYTDVLFGSAGQDTERSTFHVIGPALETGRQHANMLREREEWLASPAQVTVDRTHLVDAVKAMLS